MKLLLLVLVLTFCLGSRKSDRELKRQLHELIEQLKEAQRHTKRSDVIFLIVGGGLILVYAVDVACSEGLVDCSDGDDKDDNDADKRGIDEKIDSEFSDMDRKIESKFSNMKDELITEIENKLSNMDAKIFKLDKKIDRKFSELFDHLRKLHDKDKSR